MTGQVQANFLGMRIPERKIVQKNNPMKKFLLHTLLTILISLLSYLGSAACTTFCIKNQNTLVLGKNFDFYTGAGQVIINKRDSRKSAYPLPPEKPFAWTARYGSLTFNQMGKEFPYGGINEKGLVVEQMWLGETSYPEMDERYGLLELQWIQYQLDNAATVAEVLASDSLVRISRITTAPLHFLVCDAQGNMATIEFLEGKMVYHTNDSLPVCALANSPYAESAAYVNTNAGLEENEPYSFTNSSLDRFAQAAAGVQDYSGQDPVAYGFDILETVKQGDFTRWSIVYDIKNSQVHYKTLDNAAMRSLKLADFDFSCGSPALYIDIEADLANGAADFQVYSQQKNREIITRTFGALSNVPEFANFIPQEAEIEFMARFPESVHCNK